MPQNEVVVKNSLIDINNRKYIGSKTNLIQPILKSIVENVGEVSSFADIFAGTGVVAAGVGRMFSKASLVVNDNLFSNYVVYQAFLGCKLGDYNPDKILSYIEMYNLKDGYYGYVTHNFGGSYFTVENCNKIDMIRDHIESEYKDKKINYNEKCILLTSLLYAVDKVANTCGQYDAYLKHLGSDCVENGVHKVDSNVYKTINMKMPEINYTSNDNNLIVSMDANILVEHINPQVTYLDPPYNNRQYVDNYHVLENIARWEKPEVFGKTKKFKRDNLKSRYSQKTYVKIVFESLIKNIDSKHIFMSYNSEGIMPVEYIVDVLSKKGKVKVEEVLYNVFGNGAGRSRKRKVTEYIIYTDVT